MGREEEKESREEGRRRDGALLYALVTPDPSA
jgi:hypothetical protein